VAGPPDLRFANAGQPLTFCVADPDDATSGTCVPKRIARDQNCRPYGQRVASSRTRFLKTVRATERVRRRRLHADRARRRRRAPLGVPQLIA
jgi:hypothetical protein